MFSGAPNKKDESTGGAQFLLLVTENPLNAIYAGNQLSIRNILRGKGAKWVEVDGVQSVDHRNELFDISEKCGCKRGEYPQLFCVEEGGATVFWGDYTQVQELNDTGELREKLAAVAVGTKTAVKTAAKSKFRRRSLEMADVKASSGPEAAEVAEEVEASESGTAGGACEPYEVMMPKVFEAAAEAGVGLVCWVVDGKVLKVYPSKELNKLHVGDSYIFLATREASGGLSSTSADVGSSMCRVVHIWLGSESSIDHNTIAAFEAVELATYLHRIGPSATIHRSEQGGESPEFLALFKGTALHYLPGGIQSSLHKVVEGEKAQSLAVRTRLLHLKGRHACRCVEVPPMVASLNHGDAFILEHDASTGTDAPPCPRLYVWFGKQANVFERVTATRVARQIHDEERHGNSSEAIVIVNDLSADNAGEAIVLDAYWNALGGRANLGALDLITEGNGKDGDGAFEVDVDAATTLLRVEDTDAFQLHLTWKSQAEGGRVLQRGMLSEYGAFILDTPSECFIWIGHSTSQRLRKNAFKRAIVYLEEGVPVQTKTAKTGGGEAASKRTRKRLSRLVQHGESTTFKCFFHQWAPPLTNEQLEAITEEAQPSHIAQNVAVEPMDVAALVAGGGDSLEGGVEGDDAAPPFTGSLKIWRVHSNRACAEVDQRRFGYFFDDCCYIVHQYAETKTEAEEAMLAAVFVWIGGGCAVAVRGHMRQGTAMLVSQRMLEDAKVAKNVTSKVAKWRLVQGKEPASFLRLFNGGMVVLKGAIGGEGPGGVDGYAEDSEWWSTCIQGRREAAKVQPPQPPYNHPTITLQSPYNHAMGFLSFLSQSIAMHSSTIQYNSTTQYLHHSLPHCVLFVLFLASRCAARCPGRRCGRGAIATDTRRPAGAPRPRGRSNAYSIRVELRRCFRASD
jgi:hypothetical protein